MPAIGHQLAGTRSARWYRDARSAQRAKAWDERTRCFTALAAVLGEHGVLGPDQPPIRLPGILTTVARRAYFASAEPVYKRWRARQDGQPIPRWAGPDPTVKPGAAFVAEAKVVAFWPYREGVVETADALEMTPTEFAIAYLRVVAAWAREESLLAACHPAGAPPCVAEDMAILAARLPEHDQPVTETASRCADRLTALAAEVVTGVLTHPARSPAEAVDAVQEEVRALLAEPAVSIADRVLSSATDLTARLAADRTGIGARQATRLRAVLRDLTALVSDIAEGQS
ncbi:MAG TPA: hypothetical protein VG164_11600 [Trebonia sp.]|nr:hypothetical protein [Trebonia sp.]